MAQITAALVKQLREMTDSPMMECKKALVEADGDIEKAVDVGIEADVRENAYLASRPDLVLGDVAVTNGRFGETLSITTKSPADVADALRASLDAQLAPIGNVHDDTGTRSLTVLRPGGLYIVVPTGSWPGYAQAATDAGVRATAYTVIPDGGALATIGRLLTSGAIQVYVDRVFPLDEAAAAHEALEQGSTRGKIVLAVSEG